MVESTQFLNRQSVVDVAQKLNHSGLNQGTSGNISLRSNKGMLITPSSVPFESMTAKDLIELSLDGSWLEGNRDNRPSSEWRLHADILAHRPELSAVLHCHSLHATALACHHRNIPSFHYMISVAGGDDIRCAPYATFGTKELSTLALEALEDRKACLLAHHGLLTVGKNLDEALALAVEVETLAQMYLVACTLGEPPHLTEVQMAAVHAQFAELKYGQYSER